MPQLKEYGSRKRKDIVRRGEVEAESCEEEHDSRPVAAVSSSGLTELETSLEDVLMGEREAEECRRERRI